jgi:hypothetical protein
LALPIIWTRPTPALKSRVVLSEHAFAWKMQKPLLRPTEKQLQSSLKATDRTTVVLGLSIGGRVFILPDTACMV